MSYKKEELANAFNEIFTSNAASTGFGDIFEHFSEDREKIEQFASYIAENGDPSQIDRLLEMEADRQKAESLLKQACEIQTQYVRKIDNVYESLIDSYLSSAMSAYISILKAMVNTNSDYAELLESE